MEELRWDISSSPGNFSMARLSIAFFLLCPTAPYLLLLLVFQFYCLLRVYPQYVSHLFRMCLWSWFNSSFMFLTLRFTLFSSVIALFSGIPCSCDRHLGFQYLCIYCWRIPPHAYIPSIFSCTFLYILLDLFCLFCFFFFPFVWEISVVIQYFPLFIFFHLIFLKLLLWFCSNFVLYPFTVPGTPYSYFLWRLHISVSFHSRL